MGYGRYFSFTTGSLPAGTDLIAEAKTRTGISSLVAKKIRVVSSGSLAVDVNGLGVDSTLQLGSDSNYTLTLDDGECLISSLVLGQTSASPVFVSMIF